MRKTLAGTFKKKRRCEKKVMPTTKRKGLLGGLAAAVLAMQMSCASLVQQKPVYDSLDHKIAPAVRCIRTRSTYQEVGNEKREETMTGTGTGFVFAYQERYSYLLTAKHVVQDQDTLTVRQPKPLRMEGFPEGTFALLQEKTYHRVATQQFLVDNLYDTKTEDDLPLEVVALFPKDDLALLRVKGELPALEIDYGSRRDLSLQRGEVVYMQGFVKGNYLSTKQSTVSNPLVLRKEEEGSFLRIAIDETFIRGMSGSPLFVQEGEELHFIGMCPNFVPGDSRNPSSETLCLPASSFYSWVKEQLDGQKEK